MPLREGKGGNKNLLSNMYVVGRLSNYYKLLKRYFYFSCLIIAYCVSVYFIYFISSKEGRETEERKRREESRWRELKLSRDSNMSAQCLTSIHYWACAVFLFFYFLFIYFFFLKICASILVCSDPGCLPPSPHVPWAVGGAFPVSVRWCFGCMNGAWLPVCPLGGIADELPVFGMHNRKALLR